MGISGENHAMAEFEHLEATRAILDSIKYRAIHDMLTLEEALLMRDNGGDEDMAVRDASRLQKSQPRVFEDMALELWAYGMDCKDKLNDMIGLADNDPSFAEREWQRALTDAPATVRRSLYDGIVSVDFHYDT